MLNYETGGKRVAFLPVFVLYYLKRFLYGDAREDEYLSEINRYIRAE